MKRAFTLLEMLLANCLAVLLAIALLAVVGAVSRGEPAASTQADGDAVLNVVQTIRADLVAASTVRQESGLLILAGHGSLDRRTLGPSNAPAVVEYGVVGAGGRHWLVRRQKNLGLGWEGGAWSELLCPGVAKVELRSAEAGGDEKNGQAGLDRDSAARSSVRLVVYWDDEQRRPLDQVIVMR